jgi:hypothetical protein
LTTKSLTTLKQEISASREEEKTWRDIASSYSVNVAIIWRIVNEGYEPKNNEIRKRLGLPLVVTQYKDPVTGRYVNKS